MNRISAGVIAACLFLPPALGLTAEPVAEKVALDIPAQRLSDALNELAHQASLQLVFYTEVGSGLTAKPLVGSFTADEALSRILSGTGLSYRYLGDRTITIVSATERAKPSAVLPDSGMMRLAQADAAPAATAASGSTQGGDAPATNDDNDALDEVLVKGTRFYRDTASSMAAKIDLPLLETPQAVSVITGDLIDTFGITDLKWISKYISGLDSRVTVVAENSDFTARGFTLDLEDGFKMNGFQYIPVQPIDTVAVERVEFLKGPTGILYGRNNYGGMLNYVTKQPQYSDFTTVTVSAGAGEVELARAEVDLNTSLVDGVVAFRLPMAYELHDSTLDNDSRQFSAVPSLLWQPTEDLRVTLGGVLQHWRVNRQIGLSPWALGTTAEDVNWQSGNDLHCRDEGVTCVTPPEHLRDVFLGSDADFYDSRMTQANVKLEYRINDSLDYFVSANRHRSTVKTQQHYIGTVIAEDGSAFMSRDGIAFLRESDGVETGVMGDFRWLGREHKFYVGGDYRKFSLNHYDNWDETLEENPIDVFAFRGENDYRQYLDANDLGRDWVPYQVLFDRDRKDWGLGAQVVFELAEPLTLLVGGRYEESRFDDRYFELEDGCLRVRCAIVGDFDGEIDERASSSIFLPRAGLTWKIVPDRWTAYASYTEGFVPQAGVTRSGGRIGPETGYQIEAGVKGQLFQDRFLTSLAVWQIQREGVAVGDPLNDPGDPYVVGGLGQRNRGIELEATGQITPALNVILAASKTEGRFDESSDEFFSGKEITSTPEYKYAGYLNYEFLGGRYQGLSLGGGFAAVGPQWGVFPAAFRVDGYTTVDLKMGYAFSETRRLSLQVQNLLDESYFLARGTSWDGCCGSFGDGRAYRLSFETRL
jgi:iron complex outermembrane receptor protein